MDDQLNPASAATQTAQIRAYMEAGHWISGLDALAKFKCFRLAARIHDIKRELEGGGLQVVKRVRTLNGGKKIAEYTIAVREAT